MIFENIVFQYIFWQIFEVPKNIFKAWKNFFLFYLNYFSIPELVKTFFSHWRRYRWEYPKGFELGIYFEVFFSNLISRSLGVVLRTFLIIAGLIWEIFIIFSGLLVLIGWFLLPILLILVLWHGLRILL